MITSRLAAAAAAALLCSLFAACSSAEPPPQPPQAPRLVVELQRWEVIDAGKAIGVIKQLEIRDLSGPLAYYRIEDLDGRWRGHASDGLRLLHHQRQQMGHGINPTRK